MSKVPADLKYTKTHEWLRTLPDGNIEIGITDHAQHALGDLVFVEVPETGRALKAGEPCAVVESVKAASYVYAPVSGEDQARVIAALLTQPAAHVGKIYPLYGVQELNQREIAEVVGNFLDRRIVYSPSSIEQYREHLGTYGLPEFIIQHFVEVAIDYQNGIFSGTNDVIEKITGTAPPPLEAFLEANRDAFNV